MLRLGDLLKEIVEGTAADQAKAMGLVSIGFGRWQDPRTGKVSHQTVGDRLVPWSGKAAKEPAREPRRVATRDDLEYHERERATQETQPHRLDPKSWYDPSNEIYGPPGEGAPDIRAEIEAGEYITKPIQGKPKDLPTSLPMDKLINKLMHSDREVLDNSFFNRSAIYRDECDITAVEEDIDSNSVIEGSRAMGTLPPNAAGTIKVFKPGRSMLNSLALWTTTPRPEFRKAFVEKARKMFPNRADFGGPLARGLKVKTIAFEKFMEDFQVGAEIQFQEPYSFTPEAKVVDRFLDMPSSHVPFQVPVIVRIHPAEDGKTAALDVHAINELYKDKVWEKEQEDSSTEHQSSISHAKDLVYETAFFKKEREAITMPGTRYKVTGVARSDAPSPNMGFVIDLQELPANEAAKPIDPKPVGKIAHHFLTKPLLPKKLRKK